ncbi:MAG: aminodeoxychorismate synthase component I [Candidatus Gastranaerophilaceae bacterium]
MQIYSDKIFKNPIKIIKAFSNEEFKRAFEEIEKYKSRFYLLGYIRYEAKEIFLGNQILSDLPLLYFEVFEDYETYIPSEHQNINLTLEPQILFSDYKKAVEKIKEEIACGNTYEVNYTYDFRIPYNGDEFMLYEYFLKKQKTQYNTFIKNDYETLLSFSPELFFELEKNHIITKPMKGTVKRGNTKQEDENLKKFLFNDEKNRAENVMIVDLLRNDLGRIAKTGSVNVSKLFEIETHKTLHQMTSQIEADLKENTKLYDIFKAIFPCGSITGAPKISTMKIIDAVEKDKRGIYCGAIGFISPQKSIFSVPIRILQKQNSDNFYKYRVGGAIVWDSSIQDEWEETYTKTKFLNGDFQLIETVRIENGKMLFKEEHFQRLKNSAKNFGFKYTQPHINPHQDGILRILLNKNGELSYEYKDLTYSQTNKIAISPIIISSKNNLMYHKTTFRPWFYESYAKIKNGEIYDEIFFNENNELTEGARSNIIVKINSNYYTPPLCCGLLNGIYRQKLINEGFCKEKILYKKDLLNCEKIFCINSVRGMVEVEL